jgi:hypothetical protein
VSKVATIEIQRQLARMEFIQSLNVVIPTTRMEIVVTPTTNFVKGGNLLIGFAKNLGCGLRRVLVRRNLNRSLRIPVATIGVVGTPYMVFTDPIMTTHVNMTTYRPLMSSIVVGGYICTYAGNLGGGYQEPSIVIT